MRRLLLLVLSGCSGGTSVQVSSTPSFTYAPETLSVGVATQLAVKGRVDSFECNPSIACGGIKWEQNLVRFVPLLDDFMMEARVSTNDGPVTIRSRASAKLPELFEPVHETLTFEGAETGICTTAEGIAFDTFQKGKWVPGRVDWNEGCWFFVPSAAGTIDIHARVGAYRTEFYLEERKISALDDVESIEIHGCADKTGSNGNTVSLSFRAEAMVLGSTGPLPASAAHIENAGDGVVVERTSDDARVDHEYRLHGAPSDDTEIVAFAGKQKARLHVSALPSCY